VYKQAGLFILLTTARQEASKMNVYDFMAERAPEHARASDGGQGAAPGALARLSLTVR